MLSCVKHKECDPNANKPDPHSCGSNLAYAYFVSFIFFCSFLVSLGKLYIWKGFWCFLSNRTIFNLINKNWSFDFHKTQNFTVVYDDENGLIFVFRCWIFSWPSSWTISIIWREILPYWVLTIWTNSSGYGQSMIRMLRKCDLFASNFMVTHNGFLGSYVLIESYVGTNTINLATLSRWHMSNRAVICHKFVKSTSLCKRRNSFIRQLKKRSTIIFEVELSLDWEPGCFILISGARSTTPKCTICWRTWIHP